MIKIELTLAILVSLLSGALGALVIYFLQEFNRIKQEKRESKNLCAYLSLDMASKISIIESKKDYIFQNIIDRNLLSLNNWDILVLPIIKLLPCNLAQEVFYAYNLFQGLKCAIESIDSETLTMRMKQLQDNNTLKKLNNTINALWEFSSKK